MLTNKSKKRIKYLNSISKHERNIREAITLARERISIQMAIVRDKAALIEAKTTAKNFIIKDQWLIKQLKKKLPQRYPNNVIKRCPFCGSNNLEGKHYDDNFYFKCISCGASGGSSKDPIDALHLWNNRKEG